MKIRCRFALVLGVWVICSLRAHSGEVSGPELKTASVAAFKNGLAFVVKQGEVHLEAGVGNLEPVPNATLGSLWIAPNDAGASLDEVVARRNIFSTQQSLTVLADVLLANAGKVVTIVDNSQKEYTGEIVGFRQAEKGEKSLDGSKPLPNPSEASFDANGLPSVGQPRVAPEFLLLKSEGKLLALYFHNVARVILPADAILEQGQEVERKALQLKIKGVSGHANLTMGYLEHGLGRVHCHSAWKFNLSAGGRSAVAAIRKTAGARHGSDDSAGHHFADDLVESVRDVKIATRVHCDCSGIVQLSAGGGSAVAAVTCGAGAGHSGDIARSNRHPQHGDGGGLRVHHSDARVAGVGEVKIAGRV